MFVVEIFRAILRALGFGKRAEDVSSNPIDVSPSTDVSLATEVETPLYPYRRRDDFLSSAERNFFRVLYQTVGDKALICLTDC